MRKTLIMILLAMIWNGISAQNIALTKSKPVRMVRPESGYKLFVKAYVENEIELWQRKDPNESNARYKNRVTETKRQEMIKILEEEAKDKYLQEISKTMVLDLSLKGYDNNDKKILLDESRFGRIDVSVPDDDADNFIRQWSDIEVNPEFFIQNDTLGLAKAVFILPAGKTYTYINKAILDSMYMGVPYVLTPIYIFGNRVRNASEDGSLTNIDEHIPVTDSINDNTWVVIIANENYRHTSKVRYAKNDAESFKNYCVKTFGVPKKNIRYIQNATLYDFELTIQWLSGIAKQNGEKAKILFYYTGHGMSVKRTGKTYFVPVDGRLEKPKSCYNVDLFIDNMGALPVQSVVAFVDAGFVTFNKHGDDKTMSRVMIRSNSQMVNGNVVLCLAAQNDETAYLYEEKKHGVFTYFLLNEIQNKPSDIRLGELFYNVQGKVKAFSLSEFKTMQTPTIIYSPSMKNRWEGVRF